MKVYIYFSFFFCFLALNACEFPGIIEKDKEEKEPDAKIDEDDKEANGDAGVCFELVFPISVTMPDKSIITEEDEKSLWTSIKDWYAANPDVEEKFEYNYPLDIYFSEDDKQITLANEEALLKIKKYCFEYAGDCFEYIYPLSYLLPDGTSLSFNSLSELKAWYQEHPNSEKDLELIYPFELRFIKDDIIKLISTEAEYKAVFEYCK